MHKYYKINIGLGRLYCEKEKYIFSVLIDGGALYCSAYLILSKATFVLNKTTNTTASNNGCGAVYIDQTSNYITFKDYILISDNQW